MTQLAVTRRDGVFSIVDANGEARQISLGGRPVRAFQPGWLPRGACDSFPPFLVLDLVHESGKEASWLLNAALEHAEAQFPALQQAQRDRIVEQVAPAIRAVHRMMLCAAAPALPPELALFDGLNRSMISDLIDLAADAAIDATSAISLVAQASDLLELREGPDTHMPVSLRCAEAALGGNFQDSLQAALHDGMLACPSPVDGRILRTRHSLVLHEHRMAYRFVDERHGLVFFAGTTNDHFAKSDLYFPAGNTAITRKADIAPLRLLARQFLAHCIADAVPLCAYLLDAGGEAARFAVVCRGYRDLHIGHQLWNELTALDRLVRTVPAQELPTVIIPDASENSEVYAPIEAIFPEFEGLVDRGLRSSESLGRFVYRRGLCVFRALDEHVTLDLARRIRDASAREEPPIRDDARLSARIAAERIPCVLFGLRVENRTLVDPSAVIGDCIDHLRARLGRIVVVIDGHNARKHHDPTSHYGSFGQGLHEPPVFAELHLVTQLHRRFEGTDVEIVNLCGASMSRSLFWGQRADFFVAVWGAGLAKYRWVCNRPGLVLSNLWNLRHRGDLDIYHAPRYQEGGSPMQFLDGDAITDLPDAPVQFAPVNPVPYFTNFRVDPAALRQALDGMIKEHLVA